MSSAFKRLAGTLGIAFGGALILRGIRNTITAFGVEEKAVARLEANIKNVLVSFQGFKKGSQELTAELIKSTNALKEQAKELQKITTFGNEQISQTHGQVLLFVLHY